MAHRDFHPQEEPDCFGCKVATIGYDGGHLSRTTPVVSENTGRPAGSQTEHRDGRQDAIARPESIVATLRGGKITNGAINGS